MNITNHYSQVADEIVEHTKHVRMKNGDSFETVFWHGDENEEPKLGAYEPTGFPKLDALVKAVNPRIKYGGDNASNSVQASILFQHLRSLLTDDFHYMEMPHAKDFNSLAHYAMVLAHELIHWAGIRDPEIPLSGIGSKLGPQVRSGDLRMPQDYAIDEMAADIGSLLLLKWADVPVPEEELMVKRIYTTQSHVSPFKPMQEAGLMVARDRAVHQFVRLLDMAKMDKDA